MLLTLNREGFIKEKGKETWSFLKTSCSQTFNPGRLTINHASHWLRNDLRCCQPVAQFLAGPHASSRVRVLLEQEFSQPLKRICDRRLGEDSDKNSSCSGDRLPVAKHSHGRV